MTRCSTSQRRTPTTTTTSSTSAHRSSRPETRSTRSSKRPNGGRSEDADGGNGTGGPTRGEALQAALPALAHLTLVSVLCALLPGPDGHPSGVLARDPDRGCLPPLWIRHVPVPPDPPLSVPHHLPAHP